MREKERSEDKRQSDFNGCHLLPTNNTQLVCWFMGQLLQSAINLTTTSFYGFCPTLLTATKAALFKDNKWYLVRVCWHQSGFFS